VCRGSRVDTPGRGRMLDIGDRMGWMTRVGRTGMVRRVGRVGRLHTLCTVTS